MSHGPQKLGIAGKIAAAFANSKLTPLIILTAILLGAFATINLPREEEPQIKVPMADVITQMPGASAKETEQRISVPLEKYIWEIPGVEYLYAITKPAESLLIVRFRVGLNSQTAISDLRHKIQSHLDEMPQGVNPPLIQPRSINDIPVLALTLHSNSLSPFELRQLADRVVNDIKTVPNVGETNVIGGPQRVLKVRIDPVRLAAHNLTLADVAQAIQSVNNRNQSGSYSQQNEEFAINAGEYIKSAEDAKNLQISTADGNTVRLGSVSDVIDGSNDSTNYVFFGYGAGTKNHSPSAFQNAVTISVAKQKGINAIGLVDSVMAKVRQLKGNLIPSDVTVTVTRDYGATAQSKVNDLLFHMGIAVISVTLLVAVALGRRESLVVLVAIPVTLAITLLVFYLYGYTLNRITLFALIFSIGILVDDAIVVVENIVRHYRMPGNQKKAAVKIAIEAVDEVGNPTILATFAVIAAILPMAFVGGLMGPYMRPIPVGASAAMIFSLLIAFTVTPYIAIRILRKKDALKHVEKAGKEDFLTRVYRQIMTPLLQKPLYRWSFLGGVVVLLLLSMSLVMTKSVVVKMLPFDNKNEFQVILDMPTGSTLEHTAEVARAFADYGAKIPEVKNYQVYVGTSSPINFNGLVRHYFLRNNRYQADIQVNLVDKEDRKLQSHEIVKMIRKPLSDLAKKYGVRLKIAEVPPGPPVLETLVAEVYGPTSQSRLAVASQVKKLFQTTSAVTDVDWYVDDNQPTVTYVADQQKAAQMGVSVSSINQAIQTSLAGNQVGILHDANARETVPIIERLPKPLRSGPAFVSSLSVRSAGGQLVPLAELVKPVPTATDKTRYRKNLLPVIYVTGDVTGRLESPIYDILKINRALAKMHTGVDEGLRVLMTHEPSNTQTPVVKWDGEWQITFKVFRDLGVAFAVVLVLIYILVVAWFQHFRTPLLIMAPIPLTLIGILPAHAIFGAFFTATSMIGFIAGAGIIVRNSIILVDFIELRRREGLALADAVIDAGATRFRPMLLTAAAVIAGSSVIVTDPIFQGLAISLMAGEVASTLLSRFAVPVLYYMAESSSERKNGGKNVEPIDGEDAAGYESSAPQTSMPVEES